MDFHRRVIPAQSVWLTDTAVRLPLLYMWQSNCSKVCLLPPVILHVFSNWTLGAETTGVAQSTRTESSYCMSYFQPLEYVRVNMCMCMNVCDASYLLQSWAVVRSCYSSARRPWNLPSDRVLISFPKPDTNLAVPFLQRAGQPKAEGQPL